MTEHEIDEALRAGKAIDQATATIETTAAAKDEAIEIALRSVNEARVLAEFAEQGGPPLLRAVRWAEAAVLLAKLVALWPEHTNTPQRRAKLAEFEAQRDAAWKDVCNASNPAIWQQYEDAQRALHLAKVERAHDLRSTKRIIRLVEE